MTSFSTAYPPSAGPYYGATLPKIITGNYYLPYGYTGIGATGSDNSFSTAANDVYYCPLAIFETRSYQGAATSNQGALDSGEKARLMIFRDDAASGGPGTLEKDFGEVTCGAASALLVATSSWTPSYLGTFWAATWWQSATTVNGMLPWAANLAATTGWNGPNGNHQIGYIGSAYGNTHNVVSGLYVSTAYGVAPASAVAATTNMKATQAGDSVGSSNGVLPPFYLKG